MSVEFTEICVYKKHKIITKDFGTYIITVNEGRFKGHEIGYKNSIEACKEFIDGLNQ